MNIYSRLLGSGLGEMVRPDNLEEAPSHQIRLR